MRWIVGIDLRERSHGAVHMAAWMRAHHRGAEPAEFVGIHVVDERLRDSARVMSEVIAAGKRALASVAEQCGVADPFTDVRVVLAPSVEQGLARAASHAGIDGLLVGRIAPSEGRSVVRLGSVARRLLRSLPAPVLVVPPNLVGSDIGGGAIMLATDLGETSIAPARFSSRVASELGRDLVVSHSDPERDVGHDLLGDRTLLASWTPRRTLADVDAWVREHEIPAARTHITHDGVVDGLLAAAHREGAAILACGSRQLGAVDRIFTSSVGTDLARLADRPVLIVPSP
jgi:nucleotide-binding universal stress UspA family protein